MRRSLIDSIPVPLSPVSWNRLHSSPSITISLLIHFGCSCIFPFAILPSQVSACSRAYRRPGKGIHVASDKAAVHWESYQIISLRASELSESHCHGYRVAFDTGRSPLLRFCVLLLSKLRSVGANVSEKQDLTFEPVSCQALKW